MILYAFFRPRNLSFHVIIYSKCGLYLYIFLFCFFFASQRFGKSLNICSFYYKKIQNWNILKPFMCENHNWWILFWNSRKNQATIFHQKPFKQFICHIQCHFFRHLQSKSILFEIPWNSECSLDQSLLYKFGFNPSLIDGILNVLSYKLAS